MMHSPVSDQIRRLVEAAMEAEGVGARRFEDNHGLKPWALRGLLDPERKQSPSVDRAREICDALGLEFYIGPRRLPDTAGLAESSENDSRSIPWLEPRLGQGSAPIRLSLSWLQTVDLAIDRLRAVIPDQVQLGGWLASASLALVEVPSRPSEAPQCWAFYESGRLVVGRLHTARDNAVVLPADPSTPARLYSRSDTTFRQLGRVVWLSVVRP